MSVDINPTPAYAHDRAVRKGAAWMTQRAIDLSKGVLPVSAVITVVGLVLGGVYAAGRFSVRVELLEEKQGEAATKADLEDVRRELDLLHDDTKDVDALKTWVVAVYERADARGWDLPPLPKGVRGEPEEEAVQPAGATRRRVR
jgi:hypothetical protein